MPFSLLALDDIKIINIKLKLIGNIKYVFEAILLKIMVCMSNIFNL